MGAVPFWRMGSWSPSKTVWQGRVYLHAKFHVDPFNRLVTVHQRHRQDRTGHTAHTDIQLIAQGEPFYERSPKNWSCMWIQGCITRNFCSGGIALPFHSFAPLPFLPFHLFRSFPSLPLIRRKVASLIQLKVLGSAVTFTQRVRADPG